MNLDLVAEKLQGEPDYRVRQVWEWAARGASAYAEMTNLPAPMRELLHEEVPFSSLELQHEAKSVDGTVKALFRTDPHVLDAALEHIDEHVPDEDHRRDRDHGHNDLALPADEPALERSLRR